jgi:hypothetical protein
MKGRIATAREVKARRAFREVTSARFGGPYSTVSAPPLYHRVKAGSDHMLIEGYARSILRIRARAVAAHVAASLSNHIGTAEHGPFTA